MPKITLDFSKLPDLSWGHLVYDYERHVDGDLSAFEETVARARAAYWFILMMGSFDGTVAQREALLRAALSEYASMEDTLKRDLIKSDLIRDRLRMRDCVEPEIHMIRELRHLEVHLQTSRLTREMHQVTANGVSFQTAFWYLDDLAFEVVATELNNASFYDPVDLKRLINWFNVAQRQFGVGEIVLRAVDSYLNNIALHYAA